ncbi:TIGR00366 family protein [Escherichia coli]
MHYMKWIYPRRLRNQMILMAILMVIVPTLTIGYIVETEGRSAVLSEKEKKLSAVVNLLNQALGDRYDLYIDLPREERIRALNAELAPITENITHAFPGIGAGYYNKMLDAIITYAPSALYQNNVGVTIAADHPGREVMRTNTPLVYSGRQVRGDILNSMLPIERNGEILGYIWANELTEDIRRQAWKMDVRIIIVLTAGLLISLLLIVLFSRRLSANIDIITDGLSTLAQNIPTRLPQLPGEMGQISQSVNNLAQALRETRTLNDLIIENAADGVIAIDRQGDVTTMNPAAEVITGYQRHELVGQPYSMLFDNTQFYSPVLDTLEHGTEHVALEISFPGRDRTIELSVTTSRIHNTHGEMIGALVIFSDLTARKETQRRMAQAERLATLGELMAGVAHEVRNLMFMIAGLLLHKTPMAYMRAISAAARSTAGILVQFPFYAGIQLMMEHSGLGGLITEFFINVANKDTFPVMTFFSSALINFAVPSGGGHWVIQGPFVIPAAQALGADLGKSVMAIAYGEQWMNMAQPFWALPALAIAGLGVRDIMGYCITALLFSGVIFVIGLTLF